MGHEDERAGRGNLKEVTAALLQDAGDKLRELGLNLGGYGGYQRNQILTLDHLPWKIDRFSFDANNAVQVSLSWPGDENNDDSYRSVPFDEMDAHYSAHGPGHSETMTRFMRAQPIFYKD